MTKTKSYIFLGIALFAVVFSLPILLAPKSAEAVSSGSTCGKGSLGKSVYGNRIYGKHGGHSKLHSFRYKYTCVENNSKSFLHWAYVWKITGTDSHNYSPSVQCSPGRTDHRTISFGKYRQPQKRVCQSNSRWGSWKNNGKSYWEGDKNVPLKPDSEESNNNSSGGSGSGGSSSDNKAHTNSYKPQVTTTLNSTLFTQGEKVIVTDKGEDADNDRIKIKWHLTKPDGKTFVSNLTPLKKSGYSWVTAKSGGLNLTDRRIFGSWAKAQVGNYTLKTEVCDEHGLCRFGKEVKFTINPGKSTSPGTKQKLIEYLKPTMY